MASNDEDKVTAESHTPSTQPLSDALGAFTDPQEAPVEDAPPAEEGGLDLTMKKKKKKKVPKEGGEDAGEGGDAPADGAEGGLDLSIKKKKKAKKPKEDDEFAAKIAALDLDKDGEGAGAEAEGEEEAGDMDKGTGIWKHDETKNIGYDLLLSRFFSLLSQKNPDHASTGSKSYKIPPPQCLREGNKKTIFANIPEICKRMKR